MSNFYMHCLQNSSNFKGEVINAMKVDLLYILKKFQMHDKIAQPQATVKHGDSKQF